MHTHVNSVGLLVCPDPALNFSYPAHIPRACIDALPPQPGVYIFRDGAGAAIYIGKSVNIRHRVMSHLRTPAEAQMLGRTAHIDFELTGGEIGALLRESQLVKESQPVFNQKLRRLREMCSLRLEEGRPEVVFASDVDFARTEGLFGLFGSKKAALEMLREVAQTAGLCSAMTGLEKTAPGRPCFAHQLSRCRGACVGEESAAQHGARVAAALAPLRVTPWPYPGAVAIVESSHGVRRRHLVDGWCYLGERKPRGRAKPARFDMDVYQILLKPVLDGTLTIEHI
jgi:excinuclease Cho